MTFIHSRSILAGMLCAASTRLALVLVVAVASTLAALPTRVEAQVPPPDVPDAAFRITRGLFVPNGARAGDADATAVELNPGQLPFLGAGSIALIANAWRADAGMPGRGAGLWLGTPLVRGHGLGLGLQAVGRTGLPAGAGSLPAYGKLQLAYGLGGRRAGLGVSWSHLFGDAAGGIDTFDVGASLRLFSGLALGLVAEDVARPRAPVAMAGSVVNLRLARRWIAELVARPLGTERLEIAIAGMHVEGDPWRRPGVRLRARARLLGGWSLFVDSERAPLRSGTTGGAPSGAVDWRVTAGMTLDLPHGALLAAARRSDGSAAAGVGDGWGGSLALFGSGERNERSSSSANVVRIDLSGVGSERKFLSTAIQLQSAATDRHIAAVLLKLDDHRLGLGRLEELRELISEIRRRGKPVIAYTNGAGTRELYLASACDRVIMHPAGILSFAGLAQTVTFYKGAMDRLGVAVELVRIAEYKGAMEPFILTEQSGPVKRNRNELLDEVYGRVLAEISAGRSRAASEKDLSLRRLEDLIAIGSFTPEEAQRHGLVDAVRDEHDVEDYLRGALGRSSITISDPDKSVRRKPRWLASRVAVVMVDGPLVEGKAEEMPLLSGRTAGGETLADALDDCRRDRTIKAVVLRINSPGGSAHASDVVARAVTRLRNAGKPVIASMGDVAASGGYYVAAPADLILADPSTTTGSIGIYGFKLDVSRLLTALSIGTEVYRRGQHADQLSPFRPWSAEERRMAEHKIRHLYELFVSTVAQGRKSRGLSPERVDELGRGRVYTGASARLNGLVDENGGVIAAIDRAATRGGVPRVADGLPDIVVLPRTRATLVARLAGVSEDDDEAPDGPGDALDALVARTASPSPLGSLVPRSPELERAMRFAAPYLLGPAEGVEARLPYDLEIR